MIESLIFPSCPAAAPARLIAATLTFGSRPSTSSTKADFIGPVQPADPRPRTFRLTMPLNQLGIVRPSRSPGFTCQSLGARRRIPYGEARADSSLQR